MLILLTPDDIQSTSSYVMSMLVSATPIPPKDLPDDMQAAVVRLVGGADGEADDLCVTWAAKADSKNFAGDHAGVYYGDKDITVYLCGPGRMDLHPWLLIGGPISVEDLAPISYAIDHAGAAASEAKQKGKKASPRSRKAVAAG